MRTIDYSTVELSTYIGFVYKQFDSRYRVPPTELENIRLKILLGIYELSPLQVRYIKKVDLLSFLAETKPERPDIMVNLISVFMPDKDENLISVFMPDKKDVLVLMGLAQMLFCISHRS